MRKVAVVGVGETRFTAAQEKTGVELFAEAATDAFADAHVKAKDIQALFVGNVLGDFSEGQGMIQSFAAEFDRLWNMTVLPAPIESTAVASSPTEVALPQQGPGSAGT